MRACTDSAIGDVHLAPQVAAALGELDLDGTVVVGVDVAVTPHPALLLEPVEPAAQARRRDAQRRRDVLRAGAAVELAQRAEHVEPAERHRPLVAQVLVDATLDLGDDRLQVAPGLHPRGVETRHR